ncbi:MAG: hypothetical protein AAGH81_00150 [Bacteroidota bacterium]
MDEALLLFSFYFLFYLVALVASLVNYKKFVDTPLRFFPLLIAYTLFNEVLGYFIINYEEYSFFDEEAYNWHNVIIYNIYHLVFLGYIFWLYYKMVLNDRDKKMIKIGTLVTFLSYGVSVFFQDPFHSNLFYADCVGCAMTLMSITLHFKQIKGTGRGVNQFNLMVWINGGLLVFNLFFPFYILNGYLNVEFYLEYHLRQILWAVISVMYGLFTIGFIISKRSAFR